MQKAIPPQAYVKMQRLFFRAYFNCRPQQGKNGSWHVQVLPVPNVGQLARGEKTQANIDWLSFFQKQTLYSSWKSISTSPFVFLPDIDYPVTPNSSIVLSWTFFFLSILSFDQTCVRKYTYSYQLLHMFTIIYKIHGNFTLQHDFLVFIEP